VSKKKQIEPSPTQASDQVFVINEGGRTDSVAPDHPAALLARGEAGRQTAEFVNSFGSYRLATDAEIEAYRLVNDPSHPGYKVRG